MSGMIKPDILLSGDQLVEHSKKLEEFVLIPRGNKLTSPDDDEAGKNEGSMENLWNLLRFQRVILSNKISKGVFDEDKNRVKMISHCGKWNVGHYEDNVMYLKPHEALQLMEMSRLEVKFDTVTMSIEQAYAIFLGPRGDVSIEEYLVYSHLTRAGYIVFQHDPQSDGEKFEAFKTRSTLSKEDEMVWCVLMEKLNLPVSQQFISQETELYELTKCAMETHCEIISGIRDENLKQVPDDPPSKRQKLIDDESPTQNFLDVLKTEVEYFTYQEIFNKFSFIKRAETFEPTERKLKFHFDVFLPKVNLRRSEELPNYRLIVIKSTDKFPSNAELESLRRQAHYELPIIIAIVSESMTLHFCICTF